MEVVESCQRAVNKILSDPQLIQNLLPINASFRQIKSRLAFVGGVLEPEVNKASTPEFPPITNFMGEDISRPSPLVSADINPTEAKRQDFLAKVDRLEKDLPGMPTHVVLNAYTRKEDVLVLRGVAKRAGVAEFDKKEITVAFIEEIVVALQKRSELNTNLDKIQDVAASEPRKVTATQEAIDFDDELKALGVVPGDTVLVYPDGRKEIEAPPSNKEKEKQAEKKPEPKGPGF